MTDMRKWMNLVEATQRMSAEEVIVGLKEKDPQTIQFAQSVGMPPALINQYGDLANQVEQNADIPRKIKIAFLNAEEEIFDFFTKKIASGLSKEISRRDLFRGVGNFAAIASQLGNLSSLMQVLPKVEPKATPAPTFVDWMSDNKILEFLPDGYHEEFLHLFTSGPLPKEELISQVNNWFDEKRLPWHAIDMKEGDDNFIWKLRRTKPEKEKKYLTIKNAWGEHGETMTLYRKGTGEYDSDVVHEYSVEIDGSNDQPNTLLDYLHEFGISPHILSITDMAALDREATSKSDDGTLIWYLD